MKSVKSPKKSVKSNISKKPKELTFNYIKTPSYRTFHVDGFYGGLTARGYLYAEFFIERSVTPKKEIYKIKNDKLSEFPKKEGKEGVVREIEAGLIMDYSTMLLLKKWLDEKIAEHQEKFQGPIKH